MAGKNNLQTQLSPFAQPEFFEMGCIDPWWIAYSQRGAHQQARKSLERNGFEVYIPMGKTVVRPALNRLPSKTRHKARLLAYETLRPIYGAYVFIRRMFGTYDLQRLYEMPGVAGVCCVGEHVATVPDYLIEVVRLQEAGGRFNENLVSSAVRLKGTKVQHGKVCASQSRVLGKLDDGDKMILFVEALGRVTRIVTSLNPTQAVP